jgi:DNA-binding XRE family transcriptional regulator
MMISKYFWDLKDEALREAKRALQDDKHPQFLQRMVTLLSRCDKPKELFSILPRQRFIETWPKIRSYWIKRARHSEHRDWWETIYEQLLGGAGKEPIKAKGKPSAFFRKFGDRIKERRIEMSLSQKQLAVRAGLKQPIISQIEEGKKNITLFTFIRLCKVLGIRTIDISEE